MGAIEEGMKNNKVVRLAVVMAFKSGESVKSLSETYHLPVKDIEAIIREALKLDS